MSDQFDAAIVGGGLAGGLAALALAHEGLGVALIDAESPARFRESAFDGRTTAIAYASARVFRRLGLWPAIEPNAEPIRDILVTDGRAPTSMKKGATSSFHLHFDSRELETGEPLGFIVENRVLRAAIYDGIARADRITLIAPARAAAPVIGAGSARLTLDNGRTIEAALIVAADGKASPLRASAGLRVNSWRYPQTAIVTTVAHERPHDGVAQELFLPSGPFAILPMTENRSSIVWTERSAATPAYLALDDDAFLAELGQRFGDYLGRLRLAGPRWSYPLAFHLAQSFISPRMALVGDAAHAIHPIAGQGYNLGVKDIAALAEVLGDATGVGLDPGSMAVLENYQRWRRFDSATLAFGTDALNRLFSSDLPPLRLARDLGMGGVNAIEPLRGFFMRQAGADVGRLPALMAR
ncbi:MAG: UbiH/UbiF/VisC/COQ6 family ubiquinone biosynthesis hydroxylase [Parvularculaceae bacterium]|nr:UbiH/UbiF/VisC/COQ6 family ubiquinone biosynthesis hydroxylase [Parvularculaceae bacterium]